MSNSIMAVGTVVRLMSINLDALDEMFSDPNNEFYDKSEGETYAQYVGKVGVVVHSELNHHFNCVFVCVEFANDKIVTVMSYDVRETDDDPTDIAWLPNNNTVSDGEYLPLTEDEKRFADKAVIAMLSVDTFGYDEIKDIMNKAISLSVCRSHMYDMLWDRNYRG